MKRTPKTIFICLLIILVLASIYFVPSFFSARISDLLGTAYKTLKLVYFGYIALMAALVLVFLYQYEVKHVNQDSRTVVAARHQEYKKVQSQVAASTPVVAQPSVAPQPVVVAPVAVQPEPKPVVKPAKPRVKPTKKVVKPSKPVAKQSKPKVVAKKTIKSKPAVQKPIKALSLSNGVNQHEYFKFAFLKHEYAIAKGWQEFFNKESKQSYFKTLEKHLSSEYQHKMVYPAIPDIFKAFEYTDPSEVKAIIIGKIPWYRRNQADGLAYSSKEGEALNLTTKVVLEEAKRDFGIKDASGSLKLWAQRGVLLLNMGLTAPNDKPLAHLPEWEVFTKAALSYALATKQPKMGILWGEYAALYEKEFKTAKCGILKTVNPSPLSATIGFNGSKPFSQTNQWLNAKHIAGINWNLK